MDIKIPVFIISGICLKATQDIINFKSGLNPSNWHVINDGVMGGVSQGSFQVSEEGYGIFEGKVSLENNGGFCSVRCDLPKVQINSTTKIKLKVKGDGKRYQLRVKAKSEHYFSYVKCFETSGEWEDIIILLTDLYPTFRGRKVDLPNFDQTSFEEIGFLVGNKKEENFELMIESISLH